MIHHEKANSAEPDEMGKMKEQITFLEQQLTERRKELQCHSNITQILGNFSLKIEETIEAVIKTIPAGWLMAESACAFIRYNGQLWKTPGTEISGAVMSEKLITEGLEIGEVGVYYPDLDHTKTAEIFLPEEKGLLSEIARRLENFLTCRQKEVEIRRSEQLYKSFINASPDTLTVTNLEGVVEYSSPVGHKMFGYDSVEDVLGRNLIEFIDPNDHPKVISEMEKMFQGVITGAGEYTGVKADGTRFAIEVNGDFIRNNAGEPEKLVFITRDISVRKEIEKNLLKSKDRLRRLVETINDVIYEITAEGVIKYASPPIEKVLGYTPEELTGRNFLELVHPDDRGKMKSTLQNLINRTYPYFESRFIAKNGATRWVRSSTNPVIKDGQMIGGTGSLTDVTDWKVADEMRRLSDEKYKLLFERSSEPVLLLVGDKFADANPAALDFLGIAGKDEIIKLGPKDISPEYQPNGERSEPAIEKQIRKTEQNGHTRLEWVCVGKNGTERWVDKSLTYLPTSPRPSIYIVLRDITESKQNELALRKRDSQYSEAQKLAKLGHWELDLRTNKLEWSEEIFRIFEHDPQHFKATYEAFLDAIHPDDRQFVSEAYEKSLTNKTPYNIIHRLKMKNGEIKFVNERCRTEFDHNGQPIRSIGTVMDITEQYIAEEELRLFKIAFDRASYGIAMTDLEGKINYINEAFAQMHQRKVDELVGQNLSIFHNQEQMAVVGKTLDTLFNKGSFSAEEVWHTRKDGTTFPTLMNGVLISDRDNKPKYMSASAIDITEIKQAQEQLTLSEQKHRNLFETMVQGVVYQDSKGNIIDANPAAEKILGLTLDQLKGRTSTDPHWHSVKEDFSPFPGEEHPAMVALKSGQPVRNCIMGVFHPNQKKYIWININAVPQFKPGDTKPFRVFTTFEDITPAKEARQEIEKREDELNSAQEMAGMGSWEIDLISETTTWSKNYYKMLGYAPDAVEPSYQFFMGHVHPDDREIVDKNFAIAQKEHQPTTTQFRLKNADGNYSWIENKTLPIVHDGKLVAIKGSNIDITQKKADEEKIKLQNAKLKAIITAIPDLIFVFDEQLYYREYYAGVDEKLIIPPDQIIGMNIKNIFSDDDQEFHLAKINECIRTQKLVEYEYAIDFPEGKFYYESRLVPTGGNLYIAFVRNITDKKISEDKVRQQAERLAGIVRAIPDLMFVSDKEGRYIEYYKPEHYNLLLPAENLQGKSVYDVFNKETAGLHVEKINQCLETKTLVSYEYESNDGDRMKYFDARIVPLNDQHVLRFVRDITERKAAELEIRKLTLAVEQSPAIIVITGTEGNIQYVNPVFSEISGYTAEEAIGKNPRILKSEKTDPKIYKDLWETITQGKSWRGEWQNKKKTGELYWEDVTVSPILDDHGKIINYLAIKQDITQRKKSEAELLELNATLERKVAERTKELAAKNDALHKEISERELANEAMMLSEMRLELAMEAARMAWWEMEVESGKVIFHQRKTDMLGRKQEDFVHYNDFMRLVHPDDYEKAMTAMRKHFSGEARVYQTEYRIQKTDGQYLWFHDVGSVSQRDENGKPLYVVGFVTDISQRKYAEVALEEKTRELEEFFSLTLDFMLITDAQGNFIKNNSAWEKRLGFTDEELKAKKFLDFIHPDDLEGTYESMKALLEQKPVLDFTNRYRTKSGSFLYLNWSAVPMGSKFYAVARDITERLATEEQLRQATIEAETANRAKSEFLSRMSHELRTPMNSILGFAQLLEMGQLNPKQMKGVKHIISSGKHLLDLINEVLDISRIEAGRLSLSIEPVNLNKLILEIVDSIKPLLAPKNLSIHFTDSPFNNLSVKADRQRLRQILINLLNNAVKYNTENGNITIEIKALATGTHERKLLRISIIDTGKGISEKNIKKLFVPFERIGAERTNTEGTGLGLTVVKKLIEAMQGSVGVESVEGRGSTFWIELPVVENQLEQALKSGALSVKSSDVSQASGVILYVEDNDSNVDLVNQILDEKRPGIQLIYTTYGLQAVDLAVEHNPGLILLDLNLPDIQGDEVLRRLKNDKRTKHIPIVMLSADAMPRQISKLLKAGANEYLTKPIDVVTLLEIIDEIFGN